MKTLKTKKGITLIALIITIIVLLILAVVAISTVTGDGIIARAKEAGNKYSLGQLKEDVSLVLQNRRIAKSIGGEISTLKEDLEKIDKVEVEQVSEDMCYVKRGDFIVTAYEDGDVYQEKVDLWDGTTVEAPEIKDFNWYIYNCKQLKFFADFVNNSNTLTDEQKALVTEAGYEESDVTITEDTIVYLMSDLDLGARQTNGELTSGTAWTPIGTTNDLTFLGTFEGNNHVIKGVYVNIESSMAGLFGNSNTVQNLTIVNSYIETKGNGAGGIVAAVRGGNIILNCHNINTTVISANYCAGGVVGQLGSSTIDYQMIIRDCTNSGTVRATQNSSGNAGAGGIVGNVASQAKVENSSNTGEIYGSGLSVGGVVGYSANFSEFYNCANYGKVTNTGARTGGIVGNSSSCTNISNCYNSGEITSEGNYCGGITGILAKSDSYSEINGNISNCVNVGKIEGKVSVGGIVGSISHYEYVIEKSYNLGKIMGQYNVGGIAGEIGRGSVIRDCYNSQEISGLGTVAGIVGYTYNGTNDEGVAYEGEKCQVINSYSIKKVNGNSNVGGIIGYNESESCTITNSYYLEGTANLDEGNGAVSDLMKDSEYIRTTFQTTANATEKIWEIREGENEGYPVIIGLK